LKHHFFIYVDEALPSAPNCGQDELDEGTFEVQDEEELAEILGNFLPNNSKIHNYTDVTRQDAAIILYCLFLKYRLSYDCMESIIEAMATCMPKENNFIESMTALRKVFCPTPTFKKTEYCKKCKQEIINGDDCCGIKFKSKFLNSPLESQVITIFKKKHIQNLLSTSFQETAKQNDSIRSIKDGSLYQGLNASFFSRSKFNVAFSYYSDGVEIFKSSKSSFWPLFFTNENLPYKERFKIENMLLLGIWFDSTKPVFELLLKKEQEFIYNFYTKGINVGDLLNPIIVKGVILMGTGDLPARNDLSFFARFNSEFGCMHCKIKTYTVYLDKENRHKNVKVFPYKKDLDLRSLEGTRICAQRALRLNVVSYGVKGPSPFDKITPNYVVGMAIDEMHNLCGMTKKLITLWFDNKFKKEKFSLFGVLTQVDSYLVSIKKPNFLTRSPRSIKDLLSFFTSAEYKNIFYYYSVPILAQCWKGDKNGYLRHYFSLVHAIFILNQEEILQTEIDFAEEMLHDFVKEFEILYGKQHMNANSHLLLHLANQVRALGQLYHASCFPREAINGLLKKMVKGSRCSEEKMAENWNSSQRFALYLETLPVDSPSLKFVTKQKSKGMPKKLKPAISDNIFALGFQYRPIDRSAYSFVDIFARAGLNGHLKEISSFERLQVKKLIYSTENYTRSKKTVSCCVEYGESKNIGIIQHFVKVILCQCTNRNCCCKEQFFAIVRPCEKKTIEGLPKNDFINEIKVFDQMIPVRVQELNTMCVFMEFDNQCYYSRRVNNEELE